MLVRTLAVSGPSESTDPEYAQGLRNAVSVAVGYSLELVEVGEERAPAPPPTLLAQARLAARNGVELATVLRRYSAGYVLISDFLVQEVQRGGYGGAELQRLLRSQGTLDRLLAAVSEEHGRETEQRQAMSVEERKAERIERLLAGEALDTSELGYEIEGHHVALLARGPGAADALRALATALDRRLLTVYRGEGTLWAWLGGRHSFEMEGLLRRLKGTWSTDSPLALGEPGEGLSGWRLSHRQAEAALAVALRSPEPVVRYGDVALLSAMLKDELLVTSLRKLFLEPLEAERDGGKVARETLRAYFAAGHNVSSAAMALGVKRHTITNRLRSIEAAIERPLGSCGVELEAALRLARHSGPI